MSRISKWMVIAAGAVLSLAVSDRAQARECEVCAFGICGPTPGVPCGVASACANFGVCGASPGECIADHKSSSTVCRSAKGPCDRTEYCTGSSTSCPADALQPSSMRCRAANGVCDAAEYCTGASTACPADGVLPATTQCRAAKGGCDAVENCTGASTACPADGVLPAKTQCRAANGGCDAAEYCTGASTSCPADAFLPSTMQCRAANGVCDRAENCTGIGGACPADAVLAATTQCRAPSGDCDQAESCTGTSSTCPADGFLPSTTQCRAAGGQCDSAESCTGSSAACPADVKAPDGASCETASVCVSGGTCGSGICLGGTSEITFDPPELSVPQSGVATVAVIHSGTGGAIQITGVHTDPEAVFQVASQPTWPVVLASGERTLVSVALGATEPGTYDGALILSANGCADLSVGLTGSVAPPPGGGGGGDGGGGGGGGGLCGHGAGGLLAMIGPLLALGATRRRRR